MKRFFSLMAVTIFLLTSASYSGGAAAADEQTPDKPFAIASKQVGSDEVTVRAIDEILAESGVLLSNSTSSPPIYPSWYDEEQAGAADVSPMMIIDGDDRTRISDTTQFPYSAILDICVEWPNGDVGWGTGFMISPDAFATAGHCVYDEDKGGWASFIYAYPGRDGAYMPYGQYSSYWLHVSSERYYGDTGAGADYGVIELNGTPDAGIFGYSALTNDQLSSLPVTLSGYPGDKTGNLDHTQWKASGRIEAWFFQNSLSYKIDMYKGQSGSPVFNNQNYAVGINCQEPIGGNTNYGARINQNMKNWFDTFR